MHSAHTITFESRVVRSLGPLTYVALRLPLLRWTVVLCLTPYSRLWQRAARRFGWDTIEYGLPTGFQNHG